jgi:hypothetical protein
VSLIMLRGHLRTLFGVWHLVGLGLVALMAVTWPTGTPDEQRFLMWLLERLEVVMPLVLMGMSSGVLHVGGRIDERWGTAPAGLGGLFLRRWLLMVGYFTVALGVFLVLTAQRLDGFAPWRSLLGSVVTAAFFSLIPPLARHRGGSAQVGWTTGVAAYSIAVAVAGFWCPHDSVHQMWLPFAGISDLGTVGLIGSKTGYGVVTVLLAKANALALSVPERLLGAVEG